MLIGDLRAKAIHMVIVAGDANDPGAVNFGSQDLGRLEIRGDEDAGFEAAARGLRRYGVSQVAGGGATYNLEPEVARLRQRHRDHPVFEAERRETDGVVLEIERLA